MRVKKSRIRLPLKFALNEICCFVKCLPQGTTVHWQAFLIDRMSFLLLYCQCTRVQKYLQILPNEMGYSSDNV